MLSIVDQTRREGKRELSCEFRIRTPDGSERWIGSRARIVYNDAGVAVRASGVDTDITDRKAAEEREARYRHSLEAQIDRLRRSEQVAGAGTWEVDMVSGEAFWSDNQWRLYGLAPGGADVRIPNWPRRRSRRGSLGASGRAAGHSVGRDRSVLGVRVPHNAARWHDAMDRGRGQGLPR